MVMSCVFFFIAAIVAPFHPWNGFIKKRKKNKTKHLTMIVRMLKPLSHLYFCLSDSMACVTVCFFFLPHFNNEDENRIIEYAIRDTMFYQKKKINFKAKGKKQQHIYNFEEEEFKQTKCFFLFRFICVFNRRFFSIFVSHSFVLSMWMECAF